MFSDFLRRANLNALETFIKYGSENFENMSEKPYSQRIKEAQKNFNNFFLSKFSNTSEHDEITKCFYEHVSVYEDVYFEIGLILGIKIAFQICDKMKYLK